LIWLRTCQRGQLLYVIFKCVETCLLFWHLLKTFRAPEHCKKWKASLTSLAMNQFSAAIQLVSLWTFLLDCRGFMCTMALILSGLASIPFMDTMQPWTLPFCTPKMHFSGFNFNYALCMLAKVTTRSPICVAFLLLATTMSLTYVKIFICIWFFKMALIILQNVGPTFLGTIGALRGDKTCFLFVLFMEPDLMIPREAI
jgi:hypothetical protein